MLGDMIYSWLRRKILRLYITGYLLLYVYNLFGIIKIKMLKNANFAVSNLKFKIMKKLFTTMLVMLAVASVAFAQPRAIGGRFASTTDEFSYQHSITDGMYVDLTAGYGYAFFSGWGHYDVNASFDWTFNIKGIWNWFVGPSVGVGFGSGYNYRYYSRQGGYDIWGDYHSTDAPYMPFRLNVGGQIGFEWQFGIPLNLTVDWRPTLNVLGLVNPYYEKWSGLYNFGVGVRYRFH